MSDTRAVIPSHIELVVLGCLTQKGSPSDEQIAEAIRELCLRDKSPEHARAVATTTLVELRRRLLVHERQLTDEGARVLRVACHVSRRPEWSTFRQRYFPAIALGVPPTPAKKKGSPDALVRDVARRLGVAEASTMNSLCDALIAHELQMAPGPLTLTRIRAHILAQRVHTAAKAASDKTPRFDVRDVGSVARPPESVPAPDLSSAPNVRPAGPDRGTTAAQPGTL